MQCRAAQAKTCYFHDAQTQLHPMTWQRPSGEYGGNLDTAVVVADLLRPKVLTTALAIFFCFFAVLRGIFGATLTPRQCRLRSA